MVAPPSGARTIDGASNSIETLRANPARRPVVWPGGRSGRRSREASRHGPVRPLRRRRLAFLIALSLHLAAPAAAQTGASIGLDYASDYFWRGFSFYGDASSPRGVFFPWVGASWRQLSFSLVGELPQSMLGGDPNTTEEAWVGVDFVLDGETSIFDGRLGLGGSAAYFLYPNSPNVNADGDRNDFAALGAWVALAKVPLQPKLEYSQYFRIDDHDGQQVAFRDIYLRFSVGHDFEPLEGLIVSTGASFAYFWYPSSEYWNSPSVGGHGVDYRGFSDVVGSVGFTTDLFGGFAPSLGLSLAYVPDPDFYLVWGREQKIHVWVTAGVSYTWSLGR